MCGRMQPCYYFSLNIPPKVLFIGIPITNDDKIRWFFPDKTDLTFPGIWWFRYTSDYYLLCPFWELIYNDIHLWYVFVTF